ncbi:phosphoglucan, water dikinase, chloroplastic-like isoform X2 [Phalaenopsis equestris]|uniref:phosphoglucan, water dikinase, chloroplastic-like isoform X2 n=1 Tax=Phalaenopsis equestris TaxID=78828 RepID=UPI0009E40D78|nr:phosphoglucan, water dikinase, chloroplastic-like isoform X2 [Phalaenopsis equestris]
MYHHSCPPHSINKSSLELMPMASSIRSHDPCLYQHLRFSTHLLSRRTMSSCLRILNRSLCCRCSSRFRGNSFIESAEKKQPMELKKNAKARLRLRLEHQVEFGEHVAVLGSTKEFGTWTKQMPMQWTEAGWVCELDLRKGEVVEFKFVIITNGGKGIIWEEGENRVVAVPEDGVYDLVCGWNKMGEILDLMAGDSEVEVEGGGDGDGSYMEYNGVIAEAESTLFTEQWQGSQVSFMRSNEHGNREMERRWDTQGLDGLALELVEGDKKARNWWQKVCIFLFMWKFSCQPTIRTAKNKKKQGNRIFIYGQEKKIKLLTIYLF